MSKNNKKKSDMNFLGNLEDFGSPDLGDLDNDPTLEAELLELIGGGGNPRPKKDRNIKNKLQPILIDSNLLNLDLNDEITDGDVDENDPELLAELNSYLNEEIEEEHVQQSVPTISSSDCVNKLENLKLLYQEATKQAEFTNDISKKRRYERSLKQINDLLQKALRGQAIDESEFPPVVSVNSNINRAPPNINEKSVVKPLPPLPAVETSEPPIKSLRSQSPKMAKPTNKVLDTLIERQAEYKHAAIEAKSTNVELAKGLMTVYKQFNEVIQSVKNGETFDLDDLPPPPSQFNLSDLNAADDPEPAIIEPTKPVTTSLGEELKVRLTFYQDSVAKAKSEGNDSKARRLTRVVQQYEEAIEAFRKKSIFNYEELPPPPGRPPLAQLTSTVVMTGTGRQPISNTQTISQPTSSNKPKIVSKNTKLLLERQAQFKSAALKAKLDGDIPLAKDLLRQSMGFDHLIQASESGLPIDLSKLPSLPTETDYNFEMINVDECEIPKEMLSVSKETLFKQLQITLMEQIKTCKKYENNVTIAGDIIGAKRFVNLAKSCEKDLNGLKCLIQKNAEIPKFHYEYKMFSIVHSNPDLAETEMSVEIIKAINLALPTGYSAEQFDTYIIMELPFPNDAFQAFTTETVRRTNNPIYNSINKFQVNLKSRVFQRVVKNKQLKLDIYYRKGFLQKDKLYGTCQIKLEKLENHCIIHETFDITENRKLVAGKLEVKLKIRNPILSNQSENIKEKWLVIDEFNQRSNTSDNFHPNDGNKKTIGGEQCFDSIDVLKYEIGDLKRKISNNQSQISEALANSIKQKIYDKELAVRKQEDKLKSKDPSMKLSYLQAILKLPQQFNEEAKNFLMENKRDKAQISITKKKIVEKEIELLKDSRFKS